MARADHRTAIHMIREEGQPIDNVWDEKTRASRASGKRRQALLAESCC